MIKNIFKISSAIILSLLIFEIYFQLIEKTDLWKFFNTIRPIIGQPDYDMGYKFTPNVNKIWIKENKNRVKINNYGIHDYEINESDKRIVITGNSMVEALQVELKYNFENLTEENLKKFYNNMQINNLAMSGHGPLRQLVMLENYGYPLNPDLSIMFIPMSEFISNDLLDDSYNPAYKVLENKVTRSFAYRERNQIKLLNNYFYNTALFLIREISTIRMIYFLSKRNLNDLLGITKKNDFVSYSIDICKSEFLLKQKEIWLQNVKSKNSIVSRYFFDDLASSVSNNNTQVLVLLTGLPHNKQCKESLLLNKQIIKKIKEKYENKYIKILDFEKHIYDYLNDNYDISENLRKKMVGFKTNLGDGHLNYFGHFIYSQVLSQIIKEAKIIDE